MSSTASPTSRNNPDYWCHQCEREIRPMMAPHPVCSFCRGEFVEQIEADNDPRNFVEHDHDHDHQDHEDGMDDTTLNFEDLFRLFQAIYMRQQQQPNTTSRTSAFHPGQQQDSDTDAQFVVSFGSAPRAGATGATDTHEAPPTSTPSSASADGAGGHTVGDGTPGQHPDVRGPPPLLASLLERLGIQIQYTTNPAAFGALGGGGLFNMVGDPGDYVFGQNGLDNIITQLMEQQSRQNGPVGATDETINKIPRHKLTQEELDAKLDCSVCKDEFTMDDSLLQLECKHIFHEDCLKPWLKMSGTCPTCRFSIITDTDREAAGRSSSGGSSSQPGAPGSTGSNSSDGNTNNNSRSSSSSSTGQQPGVTGATFSLSTLPGAFPSTLSSLFGPRSTAQTGGGNNQGRNNQTDHSNRNDNNHGNERPHFDPLD